MLAFEPFQHVSVKPKGHMPFDGTIELAPYNTCPVKEFRGVGKIYVLVLFLLHMRYLFLKRRNCNLVHNVSFRERKPVALR
jgi:hypothetical protein